MRRVPVGMCALMLTAQMFAPQVLASEAGVRDDWTSAIEPMGWQPLAYVSRNETAFMKPEADGEGFPQVWLRLEHSPSSGQWNGLRSQQVLYRVDCKASRLLEMRGESWRGPNLSGARKAAWGTPHRWWTEHSRTSPQGALLKAVCG